MKFNPHEYQRYAVDYIKSHPVAAIFLGCGLGKTVITLTAIEGLMHDSFEIRKVLVVAPVRVAKVGWPDELRKWDHLSELTCSVAVGTKAERLAALSADADIYVINRENLSWLITQSGLPFDYDMCVLDELSSFKNARSERFRAFMKVRPRLKRVVGLTGTPTGNGLTDLFAEFKCLDMGERLGRLIGQYRNAFFRPDRRNGSVIYSYKPLPGAEEEIYRRISDITISMRSAELLDMPRLITTERLVRMNPEEAACYESLKKDLVLSLSDGGEVTAANAASLSGKLSQLANGAVYADDGTVTVIHDGKLDALEDIIEAANGQPVLAAYWYRHDLERITKRLDAMKVEYARISSEGSIRMWNEGRFAVGLIHPAAAGHGLNLQQGGCTLVWFGITWSLELYEQTVDRLFRQGQKSETVSVIRIVTEGTIDGRIIRALDEKDVTQSALLKAVRATVGKENDHGIRI